MIFKDFPILEHWICFNKISVPFTSPLSVTVGHEHIRFQGEGHRSIADRRLHMFTNFVVKMVPSRQNWILTWVIEVHFFDKTNGLGAIRFLVLAAKPLVLSKNLTSQTPIKIQFYVLDTIFESKKSKIRCIDTILGMWKFTQNLHLVIYLMRENRFIVLL